jgi:hypothetical protein
MSALMKTVFDLVSGGWAECVNMFGVDEGSWYYRVGQWDAEHCAIL